MNTYYKFAILVCCGFIATGCGESSNDNRAPVLPVEQNQNTTGLDDPNIAPPFDTIGQNQGSGFQQGGSFQQGAGWQQNQGSYGGQNQQYGNNCYGAQCNQQYGSAYDTSCGCPAGFRLTAQANQHGQLQQVCVKRQAFQQTNQTTAGFIKVRFKSGHDPVVKAGLDMTAFDSRDTYVEEVDPIGHCVVQSEVPQQCYSHYDCNQNTGYGYSAPQKCQMSGYGNIGFCAPY